MPMLSLESTSFANVQEGRHRAVVAEKLGIKKVPVIVVKDMQPNEWESFMKKKFPDEWKFTMARR